MQIAWKPREYGDLSGKPVDDRMSTISSGCKGIRCCRPTPRTSLVSAHKNVSVFGAVVERQVNLVNPRGTMRFGGAVLQFRT